MIEVLWHGRGGQGAFTAARLLGAAAMEAGAWSLAFPSFGPERRGAPIRAFTKIDAAPIGDRSACAQADFVVYLDETLLYAGWEAELKPGGRALVNSRRRLGDPRLVALDADGLSQAVFGRSIPNTVFLGALAQMGVGIGLADAEAAVRSSMPPRLHEGNLRLVREAFYLMDRLADAAAAEAAEGASERADLARPSAEALPEAGSPGAQGSLASGAGQPADVVRDEGCIARLRSQLPEPPSLDPVDFARSTCFAAGHLVTKNAGWRSQRPVVDERACTGCGQCLLYCPDGCLYWGPPSAGRAPEASAEVAEAPSADGAPRAVVKVDLDFCKGCGICARLCRFGAIAMAPEREEVAA